MLRFLKSFFGKERTHAPEAPYKIDTPPAAEPAKCGCGRSASGFCVGLHKLTAEEWAAHPDNPVKAGGEAAPEKKKPAAKKSATKKSAEPKAPAAIKAAPKPRAKKTAK